jgi:hypothetical protein
VTVVSPVMTVPKGGCLKDASTSNQREPPIGVLEPYCMVTKHPNREPGPDSKQSGSEKATKSRLRRIMAGDEVLLSSESIDSLASSGIGSPILSVGLDDSVGLHPPTYPRITTGIMSPRASGSFPIALPIRPKSPTVASRLNAGIQFRFLGGFDPFSSLPDCEDEPIPKQLLLHYCKFLTFSLPLCGFVCGSQCPR